MAETIGLIITAAIAAIQAVNWVGLLVSIVASIAIGALARALQPKPKEPNLADFASGAENRLTNIKQSAAPWRWVVGELRVGGPIVFANASPRVVSNDDPATASTKADMAPYAKNNKFLYLAVVLAGHECEGIDSIFFDDYEIAPHMLDQNGKIYDMNGPYDKVAVIRKHLGSSAQVADPLMVAQVDEWTTAHRLRGHAYIVVRLRADPMTAFAGGIPTINAIVRGRKAVDPRDGVTRFHMNPALGIHTYLKTSQFQMGIGAASAEVSDASFVTGANLCDEYVSTKFSSTSHATTVCASTGQLDTTIRSASYASALVNINALWLHTTWAVLPFQRGDRVRVSALAGAVMPGGLVSGSTYYAVPAKYTYVSTTGKTAQPCAVRFARTASAAIANSYIAFSSAGHGKIMVTKTGEPRYSACGMLTADRTPIDNLDDLLSAMAGSLVHTGGQWTLVSPTYQSPTITFGHDDMRGSLQVQHRMARRSRFNAVKGVYVSPQNVGQPSDYPPVISSTYQAHDAGTRIFREIDRPFTPRAGQAQRLGKIDLELARREKTVKGLWSLKAMQVQPGDTIKVNSSVHGWSAKTFQVASWKLAQSNDTDPALVVEMTWREIDSSVYSWNTVEETVVSRASPITLPSPFVVVKPGTLTVTEELYDTREGGGVKDRAIITWASVADGFVVAYEGEAKFSASTVWSPLGLTNAANPRLVKDDIAPGAWDFRVRSINSLGTRSDWKTTASVLIQGLSADPANMSAVTCQAAGGMLICNWGLHRDLDVRQGGFIRVRWSPASTGATWAQSVSIGGDILGGATQAVLPLKPGSYLFRAEDSTGHLSASAIVKNSSQATILAFVNVSTITESPTFAGSTGASTVATGSVLTLNGATMIDSYPLIDSIVTTFDYYGGVAGDGIYKFATGFDLGSVQRCRLTPSITAAISDIADQIDNWGLIDSREDFDGTNSGQADAQVWVRWTRDNPSGSPTWSDWERLDSAEFYARGFQFQCRLYSYSQDINISVSVLKVTVATL